MEIKNISYKQGDFYLQVNELKMTSGVNLIYGESGSGKSTLIDVLLGFKKSKDHSWLVAGKQFAHLSLSAKKVGLVMQSGQVFPHLTGEQCAKFAADSRSVEATVYDRDFNDFLSRLGLSREKMSLKTSLLSDGERQRLALLCALIGGPSVLLLDEPFSSLDVSNKQLALDLIKDFSKERNIPVLMVSHNLFVRENIDSCFEMRAGKIVT